MKKLRKKIIITLALLSLAGGVAQAGYSYSGYNTTVGRFNGSGYTGFQIKSKGGANGDIYSRHVGGNYRVDARMLESNGTVGAWTRGITDYGSYYVDGNYNHRRGDSVRLQFSNNWNTPVNVQVSGTWRSN